MLIIKPYQIKKRKATNFTFIMNKFFTILLFSFVFFGSSCQRKIDPAMVQAIERHNLMHTWWLFYYAENGADKTTDFLTLNQKYNITFVPPGSYYESAITPQPTAFIHKREGTWEHNSATHNLFLTQTIDSVGGFIDSSQHKIVYNVLEISDSMLWVTRKDASGTVFESKLKWK